MSKDMLGIAVRKLVTLPTQALGLVCDLLEKLSDPDWIEATKRFLRKENPWKSSHALPPQPESLLEFLGMATVPATSEKFVAENKFREDTSRKARVKICGTGSNFDNWFLGKIEEPMSESILRYAKLRRSSLDGPILAELDWEEKAETTLTELHTLMELQGHGQEGVLLNNGWANIFYIRDINGILCAVRVSWLSAFGGWFLHADSVGYPRVWHAAYRLFSRNPSAA